MSAELKVGSGRRNNCSTILSPWKTGCVGRGSTAEAVQSMKSVSGATGTRPWSSCMWSSAMRCTRPRRTTSRMRCNTCTSPGETVAR